MLNNSGTYGPDETSTNMVASVNRSQSNSTNINLSLNNFDKIMQQAASSASGLNEAHNFPNFGPPPLDVPAIVHSFQAFQTMEQAAPYLPQTSPFTHEYAVQDYFPGVSTSTQAEHHINKLNLHQNFLMNASNELHITTEKDSCAIKGYPLNIPQIPTKIFQKSSTIDKNDSYNPHNGPQNSTSLSENTLPKSTGVVHQLSNSEQSDLINPENLSQSENSKVTFEKKLEIAPGIIDKNDLESSKNPSQDKRTSTDNVHDNSSSATQDSSTAYDKSNSVINDQGTPTLLNNFISEKKRKSLEKTVRLIESILINSTNNNIKSDITENKMDDPLAFSPKLDIQNKNSTESNDYSDSDDEVLIKKIPIKRTKKPAKRTSPSKKIESTRRSHVIENETAVQFEQRIQLEAENVTVKVEYIDSHDIDHNNPFHRDSNGMPRNAVGDAKVIDMENSLIEALETIKSGKTSLTYYECPHCSLLLFHPKRFLIHTKWHTFGLLNDKRAEIIKDREERAKEKREARVMQRINAVEATGVEAEQTFPCKDCDKAFQTRNGLKNHRRRFHPAEVAECRICFLSVRGAHNLRMHMTTHEDKVAGMHQCPNCPKKFKYRHSLAKHADTHLEKTHGCPECSKMFGSVQLVKMHMKTHERMARGTTYHCSYCGKGFYETYNLTVHERTHRNDKPFKCDICESCFVTNSSLKRHHKVSHSGAKPFTCNVCQKCFSTESIRDRHELRVHSDQEQFPYPCHLCPRRYMKPKDLRSHLYKMHTKEKKKRNAASDAEPMSS